MNVGTIRMYCFYRFKISSVVAQVKYCSVTNSFYFFDKQFTYIYIIHIYIYRWHKIVTTFQVSGVKDKISGKYLIL